MHPALYRLKQGLLALAAGLRPAPHLAPEIDGLLSSDQKEAWRRLPAAERCHLTRVANTLFEEGHRNPDLLVAAVLHDIGKHDGTVSMRLPHRALLVVSKRWAPSILDRLRSTRRPSGLVRPLWLGVHHPRLGAERARMLGCSDRTCWLISHHEDSPPVADPDLEVLQHADNRS